MRLARALSEEPEPDGALAFAGAETASSRRPVRDRPNDVVVRDTVARAQGRA